MYFSKAALLSTIFNSFFLGQASASFVTPLKDEDSSKNVFVHSQASSTGCFECSVERRTGTSFSVAVQEANGQQHDWTFNQFLDGDGSMWNLERNGKSRAKWDPDAGDFGRYYFDWMNDGVLPTCDSSGDNGWFEVKLQETNSPSSFGTGKFVYLGQTNGVCLYRFVVYCNCGISSAPSVFPSLFPSSTWSPSAGCFECSLERRTGTDFSVAVNEANGDQNEWTFDKFLDGDGYEWDLKRIVYSKAAWDPDAGDFGRYYFDSMNDGVLPPCDFSDDGWLEIKLQETNDPNLFGTGKFVHMGNTNGVCLYRFDIYCNCGISSVPSVFPSLFPSTTMSPSAGCRECSLEKRTGDYLVVHAQAGPDEKTYEWQFPALLSSWSKSCAIRIQSTCVCELDTDAGFFGRYDCAYTWYGGEIFGPSCGDNFSLEVKLQETNDLNLIGTGTFQPLRRLLNDECLFQFIIYCNCGISNSPSMYPSTSSIPSVIPSVSIMPSVVPSKSLIVPSAVPSESPIPSVIPSKSLEPTSSNMPSSSPTKHIFCNSCALRTILTSDFNVTVQDGSIFSFGGDLQQGSIYNRLTTVETDFSAKTFDDYGRLKNCFFNKVWEHPEHLDKAVYFCDPIDHCIGSPIKKPLRIYLRSTYDTSLLNTGIHEPETEGDCNARDELYLYCACPAPTSTPSSNPTSSSNPSTSSNPSVSLNPSLNPSASVNPSTKPSLYPSLNPSTKPSFYPSLKPSLNPSSNPSTNPSVNPSANPSSKPSVNPSASSNPTSKPTSNPTSKPTSNPTSKPTSNPTSKPTSTAILSPLSI